MRVWHQVEEVEHGAVAFDGYRHLYGEHEWYRKWMVLVALRRIAEETVRACVDLCRLEGWMRGPLKAMRSLGYLARILAQLLRDAVPAMRRSCDPRRHPIVTDRQSPIQIAWRRYEKGGGDVLEIDREKMAHILRPPSRPARGHRLTARNQGADGSGHAGSNPQCQCPCGAVAFGARRSPLMRFICHCAICQRFNDALRADMVVLLTDDLVPPAEGTVHFDTYRAPPAVQRGKCASRDKPAIEFMRLPLYPKLAFVPAVNFADDSDLPEPCMHVFYDRRVADVDDALPEYRG